MRTGSLSPPGRCCAAVRPPGCWGCARSPSTSPTRRSSGCTKRWPATGGSARHRLWPGAQAELATALRRRNQAGDADQARRLLAEAAEAAAELGLAGLADDIAALQAEDAEAGPDRPRLRRDGQDWLLSMSGPRAERAAGTVEGPARPRGACSGLALTRGPY
jgi:hypothetical protein